MSNVLDTEKQHQIRALGALGDRCGRAIAARRGGGSLEFPAVGNQIASTAPMSTRVSATPYARSAVAPAKVPTTAMPIEYRLIASSLSKRRSWCISASAGSPAAWAGSCADEASLMVANRSSALTSPRNSRDLLPFERARSEALLARVRDVIYGSVYGGVVIAVVQGALCGGMFWILGIPSAALWGLVTVVTSMLPVVGAAGVWAPGAVYLAATGHWTRAIILAVFGAAVISAVDNFLRPRLVGGRVGLSELVMFFSVLGGLQVFGVLGIVLGPVLFAIAAAILDVLSDDTALSGGAKTQSVDAPRAFPFPAE